MKMVLKALASLAILVGLAGASIYFIYPGVMIQGLQAAAANAAGLTKRSVEIEGYQANYYEGGQNNSRTLVLLHGLGDDKNSFSTAVQQLSTQYRVILPDLQAHGENQALSGRNHSIAGQVAFLNELLTRIHANRFVIGGNSMGGHVAAAYAIEHPNKIDGLMLMNATGIQLADESVYSRFPNPVTVGFFEDLFAQLFVTPPKYPRPVLQHMANQLNAKLEVMNELVAQVEQGPQFRLNEDLDSVIVPTVILWGQHDPIVPIGYAQAFDAALKNSELITLQDAGHSPQFEIPQQIGHQLQQFLQRVYP